MTTTPIDHPDWADPVGAPAATTASVTALPTTRSILVAPGAGKFLRLWGISVAVENAAVAAAGRCSIVDDDLNVLLFVECDSAISATAPAGASDSLFLGGVVLPIGVGIQVQSEKPGCTAFGTAVYSIVST